MNQTNDNGNVSLPMYLGASCNCTIDELEENGWTCPGDCTMECTEEAQEPAEDGGSSVCGPWALSYGFFTGVAAEEGDPDYAKDLIIDVLDASFDAAKSRIGNYITGPPMHPIEYMSMLIHQ